VLRSLGAIVSIGATTAAELESLGVASRRAAESSFESMAAELVEALHPRGARS
jgi:uroporphyrinogen-III synthase